MSGLVMRLKPEAMQELHWHPNANEWLYVARGRVKATLFGANKRIATAELEPGDCGYIPMGWGHSIQALGTEPCEIVSTLDSGTYQDSSLSEWFAMAPRHLLENNLGTPPTVFDRFPKGKVMITGGA
jgi:oxalate decarboxylase